MLTVLGGILTALGLFLSDGVILRAYRSSRPLNVIADAWSIWLILGLGIFVVIYDRKWNPRNKKLDADR
jgi:hypothetical protein